MAEKKNLKNLTNKMVNSKHMLKGITLASFLESTILPFPLEAILIPLMQARREKLWTIALMATVGCIFGAVFGYGLGYFLFDLIGEWVIQTFSSKEQFDAVTNKMDNEGFWFVLTVGIAPMPFQIAMLAAGAAKYSLLLFLIATAIARTLRYFGLAAVVYFAGNQAEKLIKQYKSKAIIGLTLLVLLLWWLSSLLFRVGN